MNKTKTLTLRKEIVLAQFMALTGIAVAAPLFGNQFVAGSIVNATLFIAVAVLGWRTAILVGTIPSIIALSVGLLPLVLTPMVPFIITANAILILAYTFSLKNNYWLKVIFAGFLKFAFLLFTSSIIINLFLPEKVAANVAAMMSWPQFLTASIGGLLAYFFLKAIKKYD
ncbi:iron hydrogenase [Candidatus Parcubacteria bacterium]|nr:iron hydrogenase [Candidatus Parcubacteria bacterium]